MLRRKMSLLLALCLLVTGTLLAPAASASDYYSARTPLTGSTWQKRANINLAVQAITGAYIPYGGTFSFNQTVGARTEDRGFVEAPNGRGAMVTGGGVAQVATTLYLALLNVRGYIEFGALQAYGSRFVDSYVDNGDQAIITDYNAGIDLSFTNLTADMSIEMWASDDYVYCSITVGSDAAPSTGAATWGGTSGGTVDWSGSAGADSWFSFTAPTQAPAAPAWQQPTAPTRQLIASASLYSGDEDNVINNVQLAADSMTDTTLNSGDTFSFNETVGPRFKKYGYKRATNGRGARVVGGGVAQVATVLWLALKNLDNISIIEKSTYGSRYNQNYVDSSSDAILTDYDSRDFSFKYTGPGSITLYTYMSGHTLCCDIYQN